MDEEGILKEVSKGFPRSKGCGKYNLWLYEEQKLRQAINLCQKEQYEKVRKLKIVISKLQEPIKNEKSSGEFRILEILGKEIDKVFTNQDKRGGGNK